MATPLSRSFSNSSRVKCNPAVGAAAEWSKSEYAYNSRKKLISAKQYDGSVLASETTYTYDGVGNMLSMNAGGSTTSYTYDRFGNVLTMTDALGQTETSTYAALGRLESRTDRNGTITSYTYDALGRVLSTTAHSGEDAETVTRSYTLTGQVKTLVCALAAAFPDGRIVFDAANRSAVKLMLKTWIRQAKIRDVGAYFAVADAKKELSTWSE